MPTSKSQREMRDAFRAAAKALVMASRVPNSYWTMHDELDLDKAIRELTFANPKGANVG